jgi:hypothetical protein
MHATELSKADEPPSKNESDVNFRSFIDRARTKKQQATINKRSSNSARM